MRGMMLVLPAARREVEKLQSGIYTAPDGALAREGTETERTENAWWPVNGRVLSVCGPMSHGTEEDGGFINAWDGNPETKYQRGKYIATQREVARPGWRLPEPGETVHFGYTSMNPRTFMKHSVDGKDAMVSACKASSAYCVTSVDGVVRGNGAWAMLDQLPPDYDGGALIKRSPDGTEAGVGVVVYAGDGFLEMQPEARVGSVVVFKTIGGSNHVAPNPMGGRDLVPVIPEFIMGIDPAGMAPGELDAMWAETEALKAEIATAMAAINAGSLKVADEEQAAKDLSMELDEARWKKFHKAKEKNFWTEKRMKHH